MIRSFRLRLALLSALLTGLVLTAFGLGSWLLIHSIKIERLESEVRSAAQRLVTRNPLDTDWQLEEGRLRTDLGVREPHNLLLLVQRGDATTTYRSAHWPASLDDNVVNWASVTASLNVDTVLAWLPSAAAQDLPPRRGPGPDGFAPERRPPPHWPGERPFPPPPREPLHRPAFRPDGPPAPPSPPTSALPSVPASAAAEKPAPNAGPDASAPSAHTPMVETVPLPQPSAASAATEPARAPPPLPRATVVSRVVDGSPWRMGLSHTPVARIVIGVHTQVIDADMRGIRNAFLFALPFALILIGLGSWWFAARALRPVDKLAATTRKVTAEGLGQRIDAKGEDREFAELIDLFNRMLSRLERSFQQAHRFTADAAHELKTPLAIVQGQLERAINQAEGRAMQATLTSVLDEVRRLSVISRKLLLLSQADAGRLNLYRESVDLSAMLEELLEDTRMLAPQLTLHADIQGGLQLEADAGLLRQVLHNLISNAIKYNVENGWIRIATTRWARRIEVVVSNASQGIPSADRSRIFERFFRADPAHSRNIEGVGLGLSVSREIARAHGGDLSLKSDAAGAVEFSLVLPL